MKISTRGRYALRVMVDMAEHDNGMHIPLKDIVHGKGGGYRLKRAPDMYSVGDILRVTEGDLAPIACLEKNAPVCDKMSECRTLPMWKKFYDLINGYFDGIKLSDLMTKEATENNYII